MKIQELFEKINLHDSLLIDFVFDAEMRKLTLRVDFCLWAQPFYKIEMPEAIEIELLFENVINFISNPANFHANNNEILESKMKSCDEVEIILMDDLDVVILSFQARAGKVIGLSHFISL